MSVYVWHTNIHVYVYTDTCLYICIYTYRICMYVNVCMYTVYVNVCTYTVYVHISLYTYVTVYRWTKKNTYVWEFHIFSKRVVSYWSMTFTFLHHLHLSIPIIIQSLNQHIMILPQFISCIFEPFLTCQLLLTTCIFQWFGKWQLTTTVFVTLDSIRMAFGKLLQMLRKQSHLKALSFWMCWLTINIGLCYLHSEICLFVLK